VAFSGDGRILASGQSDGTVALWDLPSRQQRATLQGHTTLEVYSVAFSGDGKILASGGSDQTVRLWDMPTGR
jgi:WD40 repeat protein